MTPIAIEFEQEAHCCANDDGTLRLRIHDGGGGPFLELSATAWALGDASEIDELCSEMQRLLAVVTADWKAEEAEPREATP